jgi:RNA polymerase sigma-70 factor (ECF subfamily)
MESSVFSMADTILGFHLDSQQAAAGAEDLELAEALRAGEEHAYETLIQRFQYQVYSVVSRLTDDPSDAPDVVQEVFLKVFRNIARFRGESSLKTWIYRIAVNEARNHRRWFGRHRAKEVGLEPAGFDDSGHEDWLPAESPDPYEITLDQEVRELIEEAFQHISPSYRAALVLREVEELSYEEIAEILEISVGTVKSRILRGRESLRKQLSALLAPPQWALGRELEPGTLGEGRTVL